MSDLHSQSGFDSIASATTLKIQCQTSMDLMASQRPPVSSENKFNLQTFQSFTYVMNMI